MSMKVYRAFKMKDPTQLWAFVHDVKKQGIESVRTELRKLYASTMEVMDPESFEYKTLYKADEDDWIVRHRLANKVLSKGYREQLGSFQRNEFDFDVNIVFWELNGSVYLRPFCDMFMRRALDFLDKDKRLVDFAYWNNVDPPDGADPVEWKSREKIWDDIDNKLDEHLILEICSWSNYSNVDPWMDDAMAYGKKMREAKKS